MDDRQLLEKAARDMILDSFLDKGFSLDTIPDKTAARLFDEIIATETQEKTAEATYTPEAKETLEKAAEYSLLGRIAARAYAATYFEGLEKMAQGFAGLMNRLRGRTPEEAMELERAQREQEISLVPQEVEKVRESTQAQRAGESLRQLQLRELAQRQRMAQELRTLQLQDQFSRRRREEELYRKLHPKDGFGALKGALGGGLAGMAGASALRGAGVAGVRGAAELLPLARRLGGIGALTGLSLSMLPKKQPSRIVERLERERYVPESMSGDVRMASAEKKSSLASSLDELISGKSGRRTRMGESVEKLVREGKIAANTANAFLQSGY